MGRGFGHGTSGNSLFGRSPSHYKSIRNMSSLGSRSRCRNLTSPDSTPLSHLLRRADRGKLYSRSFCGRHAASPRSTRCGTYCTVQNRPWCFRIRLPPVPGTNSSARGVQMRSRAARSDPCRWMTEPDRCYGNLRSIVGRRSITDGWYYSCRPHSTCTRAVRYWRSLRCWCP